MPDIYILYLRKSREDTERERQTGEDVLQTHRERLTGLATAFPVEWECLKLRRLSAPPTRP